MPPVKKKHFAALTGPKQVGPLLRMLDGYQGTLIVRCALRLAPLVFVRPGELRRAQWSEIDLESAEWRYTVTKTDKRSGPVMKKKRRPIPAFKNEAQERAFWESHDSSGYVDWSQAERIRLANLKPSTQTISLRLPVTLLEQIKIAAHKRDVPYQSLMKVWLSEKVEA